MTTPLLHLLRGKPVLVMNKGHFPNKAEEQQIRRDHPNEVVRIEVMHQPCRFVVTVAQR